MKILFVKETDWLKRNPGQEHHLAEMLSLKGHEIRVIDYELLWKTERKRALFSKREIYYNVCKSHNGANITVIRPNIIKIPGLDYISLIFSHNREIRNQITEFSPDVIIGLEILNAQLAMRMAKKNNIPFIYYWTDVIHLLIPFKPFQPIGRIIESMTLKQSDKILAINDKLAEYVIKLGAPRKQTIVLKAGIDINQYDPNISGTNIRNKYGFTNDDIILFFMGWLYNFSGLKEVAMKLAKPENRLFKVLIVGDGDAYNELNEIRDKYNLQERLILIGKKRYQEIPEYIAAADICILPAYPWEPIMQDIVPIKLYEYMAMRKPVICTKLPGVMTEFGNDNGIIYVDKPEDVIDKASELNSNDKLIEVGTKALKFSRENSWEKITDKFEIILQEVIREKRNEL